MAFIKTLFTGAQVDDEYKPQQVDVNSPLSQAQVSQAYNQSQSGLGQQQDFLNAIKAQGGLQNQSSVFNQLQAIASGQGPNPALAQLQNATGQNVANQAALMGSQRGASANAGLIGRQAAMQGGALQQQAVGQGAALQAQQSLGALGQAGSMANQQASQQQQALNAFNTGAMQQQQLGVNALQNTDQMRVNQQSNVNQANAQIGTGIMNANTTLANSLLGGVMKGVSAAAGVPAGMKDGGTVKGRPDLLEMSMNDPAAYANRMKMEGRESDLTFNDKVRAATSSAFTSLFGAGGNAQPAKKPGYKQGGTIPGKAPVKGDSVKNDIVPIMASPGEIVIPKSILEGKNAPSKAAEFVAAELARQKLNKKKSK